MNSAGELPNQDETMKGLPSVTDETIIQMLKGFRNQSGKGLVSGNLAGPLQAAL